MRRSTSSSATTSARCRCSTALHLYLEASALAYADRGAYVGDPAYVDVPAQDAARRHLRGRAGLRHQPGRGREEAGRGRLGDGVRRRLPDRRRRARVDAEDTENVSTTNLTVADKWGNVVEYTLTIEQTGGSGIVVPGRGFLLNNELTDFSSDLRPRPTRTGSSPASARARRCRRRSCSKNGKPWLALGTPGGSTIITTVLQMLVNRIDLGMTDRGGDGRAAGHPAQRPGHPGGAGVHRRLRRRRSPPSGHTLVPAGDGLTSDPFIGAATAIELGQEGLHDRRRRARPPRRRCDRRGEQDEVASRSRSAPATSAPAGAVESRPPARSSRRGPRPRLRPTVGATQPSYRQRAAATLSSVPASFWASQIGMIESRIRAAATTLTTGAWLGRKRFW